MTFYCKITCGDPEFSIGEWNKAYDTCNNLGIEGKERDAVLDGVPCKKQCFSCMATIGERRLKTKRQMNLIIGYRLKFKRKPTMVHKPEGEWMYSKKMIESMKLTTL